MLAKALQGSTAAAQTYVDDVFSTYLYNGNGSTQTITNGIDLSGKDGMVWIKRRDLAGENNVLLSKTATSGAQYYWGFSDSTAAFSSVNSSGTYFSPTSTGFTVGPTAFSQVNGNAGALVSWTFRKAPKFFDVVTYTGNGATGRQIAHNLGSVPGCIFIKSTSLNANWVVYHRSLSSANYYLELNTTIGQTLDSGQFGADPTSSVFTVGPNSGVNSSGQTYVAYLFAHDTAADGLMQCGSYTGNGSNTGPTVTLGWEPQFVLVKAASGTTGDWHMMDAMRGLRAAQVGASATVLYANQSAAEAVGRDLGVTATGFSVPDSNAALNTNGATYIYIAIRRPNKPPTSGTQVFQPTVYTGTNADNRLVNTTIAPDMVWVRQRSNTSLVGMVVGDRLRGQPYLVNGSSAAEVNNAAAFDRQLVSTTEYGTAFSAMNGFWAGSNATAAINSTGSIVAEAFKRAPGFFDVVCYTGTGSLQTVSHNLGAAPDLMIIKSRNGTRVWRVYSRALTANAELSLNTNAAVTYTSANFNDTDPTSSVFTVNTNSAVNAATDNYVAYLFASLPGISKVGSYTGNGGTVNTTGTSQTINCGFSAGARFVLIKRTDTGGAGSDWYVFDTARGIVAADDPYLLLNIAQAEMTSNDSIDADNSGFIVNQLAATNLNVTNATYIFLAVA